MDPQHAADVLDHRDLFARWLRTLHSFVGKKPLHERIAKAIKGGDSTGLDPEMIREMAKLLDETGLTEIEVSERDVLHGAAFAAAELPEAEEGAAPPGAYTCC